MSDDMSSLPEKGEGKVARKLGELELRVEAIQRQTGRPTTDWYKRILDTVQATVVIAGVIVASQQLIQLRKNSSQTAYDTVSKEWIQLDRHFIENRDLRAYFFEKKPISKNEPQYAQIDATAHFVLNFLDYALATADHLGPLKSGMFIETDVWTKYIQKTYFSSPIVCDNLKRFSEGYSDVTWKVAAETCGLPKRLLRLRCDGWLDEALCWLGLK
mgnify:CR=1 FL=1